MSDESTYEQPSPAEIERRRADLAPLDAWNERALMILFAWRGFPERYLDLGSGTGAMVNMARRMGIEAYGFDLIADGPGKESWLIPYDLTRPLYIARADGHITVGARPTDGLVEFDLMTCVETAEHLPEDAADTLCATIARHLKPGGILIFSAAVPGQRGEHHVNCQPASYWRARLFERGISYREDYTLQVAHLWAWTAGPASAWLASNVQVFDR